MNDVDGSFQPPSTNDVLTAVEPFRGPGRRALTVRSAQCQGAALEGDGPFTRSSWSPAKTPRLPGQSLGRWLITTVAMSCRADHDGFTRLPSHRGGASLFRSRPVSAGTNEPH